MRSRSGRTRRRRRVVIGVLVLLVPAAAGGAVWLTRRAPATSPAAPVTVVADRGEVTVDVAATGTVQAATTRSLGFPAAGTVETVAVRAGSTVRAGDVLATVDDTEAAAAVTGAQDTLDDAERQLAAAQTGDSAAAAGVTSAPAEVAGRVAASRDGDIVFAAQKRVNQARAGLEEARAALAGTTLKAPIAGRVMTVAGKVGSRVSPGSAFVTLAGTSAMQVTARFPEADAGALTVGQNASVTLADRVGQEFATKVAQVDPLGTSDGVLVRYGVLLTFERAPADLLVGQTAAVRVRTAEVRDAVRVPSTAVHDIAIGSGTVLAGAGGSASRRTVRVGLRGDRFTEVTAGLSAGETVVRSW